MFTYDLGDIITVAALAFVCVGYGLLYWATRGAQVIWLILLAFVILGMSEDTERRLK